MSVSKKMAFSGSWYPADPKECKAAISSFLKEKEGPATGHYLGGIVPHAGWFFSGSIACRVIASLSSADPVDLVVLFGGHLRSADRALVLASGSVETPLGNIQVAEDVVVHMIARVNDQMNDQVNDRMNDRMNNVEGQKTDILKLTPDQFPDENTLELQYPFIKHFFPDARIVVCCVPPSEQAMDIGRATIDAAVQVSKNVRVIGSTDMTHYGPNFGLTHAGSGQKAVEWVKNQNDRQAIDAMVQLDEQQIIQQGLSNQNMCCSGAAAATVAACKANGAVKAKELDYATSFEKSAGSSFVGYAGILYS